MRMKYIVVNLIVLVQLNLAQCQNISDISQLDTGQIYCMGNIHHFTNLRTADAHSIALTMKNAKMELEMLNFLIDKRKVKLLLIEWPVAFQILVDSIIDINNHHAFGYYNQVWDTIIHYEAYLFFKNLREIKRSYPDISIKCIDQTPNADLIMLSNSIMAIMMDPFIKLNLRQLTLNYAVEDENDTQFWNDYEHIKHGITKLEALGCDEEYISILLDLLDLNRGRFNQKGALLKLIKRIRLYYYSHLEKVANPAMFTLVNSISPYFNSTKKREEFIFETVKSNLKLGHPKALLRMGIWHLVAQERANIRSQLVNNENNLVFVFIYSQYHKCLYDYNTFYNLDLTKDLNISKDGDYIFILHDNRINECNE